MVSLTLPYARSEFKSPHCLVISHFTLYAVLLSTRSHPWSLGPDPAIVHGLTGVHIRWPWGVDQAHF
jgi:hypothetical protein